MTLARLLLRNLRFHWRGNLAVTLGVLVGCSVLTGALLVGDSLRGSLRNRALDQLGWVDVSLVTNRLFTEKLSDNLSAPKISPALVLQSAASTVEAEPLHANKVMLFAVPPLFLPQPAPWATVPLLDDRVILNRALADRLKAKVGDRVSFLLQNADSVPRETLVGKRKTEDVLSRLEATVGWIWPNDGMGNFTLRPSAEPPLNAFVPLRLIQEQHNSEEKKSPLAGRINAIFAAGVSAEDLNKSLKNKLTLEDWNLTLRTPADRARDLFALLAAGEDQRPSWQGKLRKYRWNGRIPDELARQASANGDLTLEQFTDYFTKNHGYLSLESTQVFLEPGVVTVAGKSAKVMGWNSAPTLAYMVDTLGDGKAEAPYVIVAALDAQMSSPLGPFDAPGLPPLADDQIMLARWPGCPLKLDPGQTITLSYDKPDASGRLERQHSKMRFAGWIELTGVADDQDLTPRFEGITDRLSIREWADNLPFAVDKRRLKLADHEYWDRYRATPKAYVTLATGQRLWGSRFGNVTSIRLAPKEAADFQTQAKSFSDVLLNELRPADGGFVFDDVKQRALASGQGSSDFGMLFLGFSCFLIVAAMLMVSLMHRLNLERRASQMGLLLAVGWRRSSVRRLALAEGATLAIIGGALGIVGAILYAWLLLKLLSHWWPGALDQSFLRLHITWESCLIGFAVSVVVSVLTIWWSTRFLAKTPPRNLLTGNTEPSATLPSKNLLGPAIAGGAALGAIALLCFGATSDGHEAQAGSFLGSGMCVLIALMAGLFWWMRRRRHGYDRPAPSVSRLGFRNASRNPARSLLTVGLLGAAVFLVVAVQAFHRDAQRDFLDKNGGSGGYPWIGEATLPIFQDPNSLAGRSALGLPSDIKARIVPLRVQPGDDASCLNLYKARQPRIVGVPSAMIDRGGFRFTGSEKSSDHPWRLLSEHSSNGVIPAIGEANTVKYMFNSGLGQEIIIRDGAGKDVRMRIVALLQDSVFQSELLVAEENFLKLFPRQEGSQFFLIEGAENDDVLRHTLETALADYGFAMTRSQERLQSYLDVQNTYLATFQALGGLGLLLGTLGLAVVLLRSVWERRGELALLRALGFRQSALGWLVLAENAWLLALGVGFGCIAAGVAVAPFIASQAGDVLQPSLLVLLALVVVAGLAAGGIAAKSTLRTPLIPALRRE